MSLRQAAQSFEIPRSSLSRFIKRWKFLEQNGSDSLPAVGYSNSRQIFDSKHEDELVEYLLKVGRIYYSLSTVETRKLAYEYANANIDEQRIPKSWFSNKAAG